MDNRAKAKIPWYKNAIFYELYVRAFRDSNGDGHGDLLGVIEKLDYLKDLRIDCIWLLPIYPSPLKDDGYDISDYHSIHPDYGTLDDLEALTEAIHARGMRVIVDMVVNHTSDQHPWFIEARSSRESPMRDYYVWSDTDQLYKDTRVIFLDVEDSNWTFDEGSGQYYWHRFYSSQPDLNYDNPQVQNAMLDIMRFWLDRGIDGFRMDAVPYLYERSGTICENLPETHEYLKLVRRVMDEEYPHAVLLAEANQLPYDVKEYFGDGDEMHMAFHFPLMPRIFQALALGDSRPIYRLLDELPEIPETAQWCVFLRNHDELTLEMVSEEDRQWMWQHYAPEPVMRQNLGIRRRLAPLLNGDRHRIKLANSILFTIPGAPIVYYGDEIGMGEDLSQPDRYGVRTPMQWHAGLNAGFSEGDPEILYQPVISGGSFDYRNVNVTEQEDDPESLLNVTRQMIATRKCHSIFTQGTFAPRPVDDPALLVLEYANEDQRALVAHNLADTKRDVSLPADKSAIARDILNGNEYITTTNSSLELTLAPFGSAWVMIETHPTTQPH